jgi:hypothetical protein
MVLVHAALAHQGVRNRDFQRLGQCSEFRCSSGGQHSSAGIDHRMLRLRQRFHDLLDRCRIHRWPRDGRGKLLERINRQIC